MKSFKAQLKSVESRLDRLAQKPDVDNVTGVHRHGDKYESQITINGKSIYLGLYTTLQGAAAARRGAEMLRRKSL